jgi:HAMP domain-containing protein
MISGLSVSAVMSGQSSRHLIERIIRLGDAQELAQRVQKRVFEGRMHIWMALAGDDEANWARAEAAFQLADQRIVELRDHTVDPQRLALVAQLKTTIDAYRAEAANLKQFKGQSIALDTAEAKATAAKAAAIASDIERLGEQLNDGYQKAADVAEVSAMGEISTTINTAVGVGLVSVLIGFVLAIVMARSVAVPIAAMTEVMRRLSRREMATTITGLGRKDEVGAMADAVKVFKESMIRSDELAAAQEATKAAAAASQKAALNQMADRFEAEVGHLVSMLAASSTEMEATAKSMTATAEQTAIQAQSVAAASEEADQPAGVPVEPGDHARGGRCAAHRRGGSRAGRRSSEDWRRGWVDQQHRVADQSAGAERDDRSRAGRRRWQRLCRGGLGGEEPRAADRRGDG